MPSSPSTLPPYTVPVLPPLSSFSSRDEVISTLEAIAGEIMTSAVIAVAGASAGAGSSAGASAGASEVCVFRILELEAYVSSEDASGRAVFDDPFAHGHPLQAVHGAWYFHRSSNAPSSKYKGGSFKGLDIAVGFSDPETGASTYAGFLIRGIAAADGNDVGSSPVSGPCKVVNTLLSAAGAASIVDLVGPAPGSAASDDDGPPMTFDHPRVWLACVPLDAPPRIIGTPRVGLTLAKCAASPTQPDYIGLPLRWITAQAPGHQKVYAIVALLAAGLDAKAIAKVLRSTAASVTRVSAAYTAGLADPLATVARFSGVSKMTVSDTASLLGATMP